MQLAADKAAFCYLVIIFASTSIYPPSHTRPSDASYKKLTEMVAES